MKTTNIHYLAIFFITSIASIFLVLFLSSPKASALSGSNFKPGRIIDDSVFQNETAMSVTQIQNFLNSKVPVCDTDGSEPYAGTTRAEYGASRGNPAPYTCLKDYTETVRAISSSEGYCTGSTTSGTKSAAQIIYDVSRACDINPQVLIVMLQKEQSLITDDWPWDRQYEIAMGYGCPDTAPCDEQYYGFFNQTWQAANAFKRYAANPTWYNYRAGRNNTIYWHPDLSRCGSSTVYIENQATAGLYIYTPYRPNQAALNNLYGTGDSCSSYGNRNFWRMFNDWFGSTDDLLHLSSKLTANPAHPTVGQSASVSFTVKNSGSTTVNLGRYIVAVRDSQNRSYNYPITNDVVLAPGAEYTYYAVKTFSKTGTYRMWIAREINGEWTTGTTSSMATLRYFSVREPNIGYTQGLIANPANPIVGQNKNISFKIKNNESTSVNVGSFVVAVRDSSNKVHNYPVVSGLTLAAGEEYTYYFTRKFTAPGTYRMWVANNRDDGKGWVSNWPSNGAVTTLRYFSVE